MNKRKFSYNGYRNYETWAMSVWGYPEAFFEIARDEEMTQVTAEWCEDQFDYMVGQDIPRDGIISDLVNTALSEVDWREIAEVVNEMLGY